MCVGRDRQTDKLTVREVERDAEIQLVLDMKVGECVGRQTG